MTKSMQELEQSIFHAAVSWLGMNGLEYGGKQDMQTVLGAVIAKGRLSESQRKIRGVDRRELSHIFAGMIMDVDGLDIRMVIGKNRQELSSVCHTHNYCDANMVMLEAMSHVAGVPVDDIDVTSEEFTAAANVAWDLAASNDFYYPEFVETRRFSSMLSDDTCDMFDGPGLHYAGGQGFIEIYVRDGKVQYALLISNREWVGEDLGRMEQRLCSWCLKNNWRPGGK